MEVNRRTRTDWAEVVRKLVDEDYPNKERIVMDNLNTHHPASLYAAFEPAEARRIAEISAFTPPGRLGAGNRSINSSGLALHHRTPAVRLVLLAT